MLAADCFSHTMAPLQDPFAASQVAEKVMRRIEVAKVARNLHDCLAFASFKAQNGWQNRTLRSIEPEVTEKLKRKRPVLEDDIPSDASTASDEFVPTTSIANNRFSRPAEDAFKIPEQSYTTSRKRFRSNSNAAAETSAKPNAWKHDSSISHSSPGLGRGGHTNFVIDSATIPHTSHNDSPMFDVHSDDDDLPMQSYAHEPSSSIISSSPPRTPPPTRRLLTTTKHPGADLLLYLANSPSRSPAINVTHISSSSKELPSTPPPQHAHLPSSVMNTPGANLGLFNGAIQTPGQNFNFADFCNVTPSPGPAQWGSRTPAAAKTPGRFTKRGLNFDSLAPPSGSPNLQRKPPTTQGLALQLGDELLPRS